MDRNATYAIRLGLRTHGNNHVLLPSQTSMNCPSISSEIMNGSFRDPAGRILDVEGRIIRAVTRHGADAHKLLSNSVFLKQLVRDDKLVAYSEIPLDSIPESFVTNDITNLYEHKKINFISHPYEWTFSGLKSAALLHLDIQLEALTHNITLIDSSAYNLQFNGPEPIFIDHLSFRPYHDGALWEGHRQFCEQFLTPLLFQAILGEPFNKWYRGSMNGISGTAITPFLPIRSYLNPRMLTHILLPTLFEQRQHLHANRITNQKVKKGNLPKSAFRFMLTGLRKWISSLEIKKQAGTRWGHYTTDNSYTNAESEMKQHAIAEFSNKTRPSTLWDFGCNTGHYSSIALKNGAVSVVGFDSDSDALEAAFQRAKKDNINFLPLYQDLANPSADQGWKQMERLGLMARRNADAILALALIHHLTIGNNIPLEDAVAWIIESAPVGIIEFVPRTDPMIIKMLSQRKDIFETYSWERFLNAISSRAKIVRTYSLSEHGRHLVWYDRQD